MHTRTFIAASALLVAALGCRDDPISPTDAAPATPRPTVAAAAVLAFWQVSGGNEYTCSVTTEYLAYCWGDNSNGQLGDGTTLNRLNPVAVATTLRFRQVSAGYSHTCGVTPDYQAYCWGSNYSGELGDGTRTQHLTPVPVADGRRFRQVDAGERYTCGVTYPDNRAYCWGTNDYGQLGNGTRFDIGVRPVAVVGGLYFKRVSASARGHTCGITTVDQAYCWGWNLYGQLGDSTTTDRFQPTRVAAGTRRFRYIDVGKFHTCAVTTDYRAFCWGNGREGQIGNGKTYLSLWPRAVAGGLHFDRVTTGKLHTCGETTDDRAYCWGSNSVGQLGDGTTTQRLTPVPVAGSLSFAQLSAGWYHTCGKTTADVAYCWGPNFRGQLGDGTTTKRLRPTRVAGAM
jgi:alpha-tubulin suppressor-like RCC1 family protein